MLTEFTTYLYVQKLLSFGGCSACLIFAMIVSLGFFPLSGIKFTSLFGRGFLPFFVVCGLAVVCSRREVCVVVTVVFGSRRLVLSPGRWGGRAP